MINRVWTTEPRFLTLNGRRLFALDVQPAGSYHGVILYLPPFAEEMNRLRCHVATQARALAGAGWRTLLLDPTGTGESEGQIAEADWTRWREDAAAAARWLQEDTGKTPVVWGVRTGALLAAELAAVAGDLVAGMLFWQPVVDGKLFLTQYLRLRIASQLVSAGERETTESLLRRLKAQELIEVAGYPLNGVMAETLSKLRLSELLAGGIQPVAWLEIVAKSDQSLPPASRKVAEAAAAQRLLRTQTVECPPVWQVAKRSHAVALIESTLALMQETEWT